MLRRWGWMRKRCALKVKDAFIVVDSNVYFQQYGEQVKGALCILQREARQLIPSVIIYGFHLDYKWQDLDGAQNAGPKKKVMPPPVDGYNGSGG